MRFTLLIIQVPYLSIVVQIQVLSTWTETIGVPSGGPRGSGLISLPPPPVKLESNRNFARYPRFWRTCNFLHCVQCALPHDPNARALKNFHGPPTIDSASRCLFN